MSEEKFSILLIDDDEVDRMTVKRALKAANFPTVLTEAENGQSAIAKIKEKTDLILTTSNNNGHYPHGDSSIQRDRPKNIFDLILLDYRLPDIDGLHLIDKIKALNVDLPLIVLTGQGDEEIAVEIMKAGAADYLSKARIEPNNLVKSINSAIRVHQAEQAVELANQRLRMSNELLVIKNRELEQQKQQIKAQNIELQEAYKLKSEFLATMSHELRTPMNAIMGFSQLLLRQYPDPLSSQQQNLVQRIFSNSKNLLNMINEMLDFSKIEAGKLTLNPQKIDLSNLIKVTIKELSSLAIDKHLDVVADIRLKDCLLFQDANFVRRSLINLLSNAIKFTESGTITIKTWETDEDKIAISVTDTGIGIATKDRDKIFQAFRQADQSFTRQHSGTGLGLAITKSLVKMMNGKITLQSELGKGSTFTIEIPRRYDA